MLQILSFLVFFTLTFSTFHTVRNPSKLAQSVSNPSSQWFSQVLDHFDSSIDNTWNQQYFHNNSFVQDINTAPLFIYIGGEGPLTADTIVIGMVPEMAAYFKADLYALEHRYYGESIPTANLSVNNLQWLTTGQAMMDLATFIHDKKSYPDQQVFVFGCSYPGAVSAFFRTKFPGLITGAIASSAPVEAKADFIEYDQMVSSALDNECKDAIKNATRVVQERVIENNTLAANVTQFVANFTCSDLQLNSVDDGIGFLYVLADMVAFSVQYNKPPERNFISEMCSIFTQFGATPSDEQRIQSYIQFVNHTKTSTHPGSCASWDIRHLPNSSAIGDAGAMRSWMYQSCSEYQFWQTGYPGSLRSELITVKWHTDGCDLNFPLPNNIKWKLNTSASTNIWTSGKNLSKPFASWGIHWSNGQRDPWSTLSIRELEREFYALESANLITDGAHCWDFGPTKSTDSKSLTDARLAIRTQIGKWMQAQKSQVCSCGNHGLCYLSQCYCSNGYTGSKCDTAIENSSNNSENNESDKNTTGLEWAVGIFVVLSVLGLGFFVFTIYQRKGSTYSRVP